MKPTHVNERRANERRANATLIAWLRRRLTVTKLHTRTALVEALR